MAICQANGWAARFRVTFESDKQGTNEELPVVAWLEEDGYCDGLVYAEGMECLVTVRHYTNLYHNVKFSGYVNVASTVIPAHPGERLHYSTGESVRVLSWVVKGEFNSYADIRALIVDREGLAEAVEFDGEPGDGQCGWIADNWRDEEAQGGEK